MEVREQIERFQEFIDVHYREELLTSAGEGKRYLNIDFAELSSFDPVLAEELLNNPEEVIKAAELALEEFELPEEAITFKARFFNLPATQYQLIRDIRSYHMGKLLVIEGLVRQKSDVRPMVVNARFECPSCGNILPVIQTEAAFREPMRCGCGRKGKFRLLSRDLIDAQGLVLEESTEQLDGGGQPKRMNVFLKEDLVSPITEKKTNPGSKVRVVGFVKEVPILKQGVKQTKFDLIIEANSILGLVEDFGDIEVSKTEEKEILELAKNPDIYNLMIDAVAPSIYGYDRIKEALVIQMMGGVHKTRTDSTTSRGDIHILLVGDPGAGKSQLLKRISTIAPKSRYVSGKGVSGAGLTAAVVKDEFLGGWSLEAGALVLANNGLVCIDEMDKMTKEDRDAMHEAMEQQTVSIAKANIQATLMCRTTVLAAANPKYGRFDPYDVVANQIDLPPTLINRFDLIFPIKDLPDPSSDEKTAAHILALHKNPEMEERTISSHMLRRYVAYARQHCNPQLSTEALQEIQTFYVQMRNSGVSDDRAMRSVPISARQLEALVRMAEASARIRISHTVEIQDARRSINLLMYCLLQVGLDRETGQIDIDRISTGIGASQRERIGKVKEIIRKLSEQQGGPAAIENVVQAAIEEGMKESEVEEVIERLKRSGDVFEPRRGFVSWTK